MSLTNEGALQLDARAIRAAVGPTILPVPLTSVREVNSNDIPALTDTPKTDDPGGFAGLLGKDTTPNLEFTSGDSDSSLRLDWASGNDDAIVFQVPLPNLDVDEDLTINFLAGMDGDTDTPEISADTFFDAGDTKVEDDSAAVEADVDTDGLSALTEYDITIDNADIPDGAHSMTVELTPGDHSTDQLFVYGIWVEYYQTLSYRA